MIVLLICISTIIRFDSQLYMCMSSIFETSLEIWVLSSFCSSTTLS